MNRQSKWFTIAGVVVAIIGALGSVDLVPVFGSVFSAKVSAVVAVIGAIWAGIGKALGSEDNA